VQVVQINYLPAPAQRSPAELLAAWPSLADIAEMVAGAGVQVRVIQCAAYVAQITRNDIDYHFADLRGADRPSQARRLAAWLDELGADVVHVHGLGFARHAHALSCCLPDQPLLLQDHADRPPRGWRRPFWRRWYAAADGVAFTSTEQAQPFAQLLAKRTRLFAIPESSSRFTPGKFLRARADTGLQGDPCVLWIGHLNANKDPMTMLEGIARASERLPGLRLWCAFEDAPLLEAVRSRIAADRRLRGRVTLLGRVPHARVETLMRAADVFVSASRVEGCGYALLEALACGTTPVVTDIPAYRALTDDGRIGMLWPCGDAAALAGALVRLWSAPLQPTQIRGHFDAHLSLSALGRRWAEAYAQLAREER